MSCLSIRTVDGVYVAKTVFHIPTQGTETRYCVNSLEERSQNQSMTIFNVPIVPHKGLRENKFTRQRATGLLGQPYAGRQPIPWVRTLGEISRSIAVAH